MFPVIEWVIHVGILHWRPRRVGPVEVDSLLARKHREHHADPRDLPLVFIPWPALCWLLPAYVLVACWRCRHLQHAHAAGVGLRPEVRLRVDALPRAQRLPAAVAWFRSVWRNHRLHHYKNEHYWFTVTTSGTADRLFGTYPDPATVQTSPTVKALHANEGIQAS